VWSYTPRSLTDIQNLVNAIQNNNPSLISAISDLQYVPAPYFAGQVSLTQVAAFIDNVVRNYSMVNPIANFIANNPYNLWTTNFVSSLAANPYLSGTSLNMLLSNVNMPANYAQFLLYYLAQNYYYNKWVQTVTASAPSITFSANATISTSPLIAQSITIASGVTVTCGTRTCFIITQSFNSQGTIVAYGAIGGTPASSGAAAGGTGGGGIAIIAVTAALGTVNVAGSPGGNGVTLAYTEGGLTGVGGLFAILSGMTIPIGGTGGASDSVPTWGAAGYNGGGSGGGGEPSGGVNGVNGGNATAAYSFASASSMLTYILQGVSDWWLLNVVGKAPSSTTPLLVFYGSGGGSASYGSGYVGSGSGGGGGGEAIIYAFNIISGTVNAAGGAGGNSTGYSGGGGGGGGGLVFILYGATSGSVTANVAGGAGGVSSTGTYYGATGASGTAYIANVTVNG
jgi:hypothetical protein